MKLCGLILARKSSKSIPGKNIKTFIDKPLTCWVLIPMIESKIFDEIWISTDDEEIVKIAKDYNVNIHWRNEESGSDVASSLFSIKEFLHHKKCIDVICLVQCTSPFLNSSYLSKGFDMMKNQNYDSVFSVTKSHKLRWSIDKKPLNFDPQKRPRRQDWEGEFIESGHFYFSKRELIEDGFIQGRKIGFVEMPKEMCIEIDDESDWNLAENMAKTLHLGK